MSRIGKLPINLPAGVTVNVANGEVSAKGPKGELSQALPPRVEVAVEGGQLIVQRIGDDRTARSMHGLARSLLANMITGVGTGFSRTLEIIGVGYRVEKKGDYFVFTLGYSHPIYYEIPRGVGVNIDTPTRLTVSSADRQLLGSVAAKIRSLRAPEPYKGKGVKYVDETIRRKEGKSGGR
jgi:large subunit ribosomal protein L6